MAKSLYREWTGGGHKVHGTNSEIETSHDVALLFGLNIYDLLLQIKGNNSANTIYENWHHDLIGARDWESLELLFYVLNATITYVVLRNFEVLPQEYNVGAHGDIDLLVSDYNEVCLITNGRKVFKTNYRVHHAISINGNEVLFDFRSYGDNYYDIKWQKQILLGRKLHENGFYRPDNVDYFYSLLYHALNSQTRCFSGLH